MIEKTEKSGKNLKLL